MPSPSRFGTGPRVLTQRGDVFQRSLVLSYLALAHHQLSQGEVTEAAIATSLQLLQKATAARPPAAASEVAGDAGGWANGGPPRL